jgi:hypothetical protein
MKILGKVSGLLGSAAIRSTTAGHAPAPALLGSPGTALHAFLKWRLAPERRACTAGRCCGERSVADAMPPREHPVLLSCQREADGLDLGVAALRCSTTDAARPAPKHSARACACGRPAMRAGPSSTTPASSPRTTIAERAIRRIIIRKTSFGSQSEHGCASWNACSRDPSAERALRRRLHHRSLRSPRARTQHRLVARA